MDVLAYAVSGLGFAIVLIQWGYASAVFPIRRLAVLLSLGFVVAGLICYGFCYLDGVALTAAFACSAIFSSACLAVLIGRTGCAEGSVGQPAEEAKPPFAARHGGQWWLRLCVAMFVMELAARSSLMLSGEFSVSMLNYSEDSFELSRLFGTLAAAAVLLAVMRLADHPLRMLYMMTSVLLVVSCLFLAFWTNNLSPYVTYVVAFAAGAWLETVFWVLFSQSHHHLDVPLAHVWGGGRFAFWASTFCGAGAWSFFTTVFRDQTLVGSTMLVSIIVAMALCIVVVYVFVLPPSSLALLLGTESGATPQQTSVELPSRPFRVVLEELAEQGSLSRRETEVFELLARGRDTAYIQNELCISAGTVSSHRDRIYKKLGVHSKQELIDLVEKSRREE